MSLRDHVVVAIRSQIFHVREIFSQVPYIRVYPPARVRPKLMEMSVEGSIGECAICQEEFQRGETFIPLPCNEIRPHKFHKDCIKPWLRNKNTCPMCRGTIS